GRIRTYECRFQRPVPYHLATPQHERRHTAGFCVSEARPSERAGIVREPLLTRGLLTLTSPPRIRRVLPFYKERRANQFRVRLPEWRVVALPRCQTFPTPQSRCPQVTPRSRLLSVMPSSLYESPGRGQTPRPRNHL